MKESKRLKLLAKHCSRQWERAAKARINFHKRISDCAENGKVALIESGMDCDCVQYSGRVTIIDADWRKIDDEIDHIGKWADGPFCISIEKPSIANEIEYNSRDLALEAFEDGHPHLIHF
jgi:hypothetical protein